tara:strand:+ start:156 stop:344 length:189 start_codon:yes stop_codon:yes gene_type:complete
MKNFLLQCITNDIEYHTSTSMGILCENDDFVQLARKLLKDVNEDNYQNIAKKLYSYANENLI